MLLSNASICDPGSQLHRINGNNHKLHSFLGLLFFFFLLQLEGRVLTPYINPLGMSQCPIFGVPFAATHCAVDLCNALIAGQELI